jgi:selT/selW/selH-like putative selenoprotein
VRRSSSSSPKGGAFEVIREGKTVFSKLASKRFPAYQEIPTLLGE